VAVRGVPPRIKCRPDARHRPWPRHRKAKRGTPPRPDLRGNAARRRHHLHRHHPTFMKTILIIEDEPEMRRNLATILRLEKYHPVSAENGRAGVEAALREKPDLIL